MASCSLGKVEESRIVSTSVVTSERETEEPQFNSRCMYVGRVRLASVKRSRDNRTLRGLVLTLLPLCEILGNTRRYSHIWDCCIRGPCMATGAASVSRRRCLHPWMQNTRRANNTLWKFDAIQPEIFSSIIVYLFILSSILLLRMAALLCLSVYEHY